MSKIEERIVAMKFDNRQFESGVRTTMSTLDRLKAALKMNGAKGGLESLSGSTKGLNLNGIASGVQNVSSKFSALGIIGVTALATIASKAVQAGLTMANALTFAPIMDGFREYELKMGSIQTVLANTSRYGTKLPQVTKAFRDLNEYADKTIYNFGDMTRNVGLFTNAGMRVEEATSVIKGFSNEAAASGTSAQGAASAAYQLSQALSAGVVRLMDWRSLQNVGMGNANMKRGLIDIAIAMGVFEKGSRGAKAAQTDFNGSLETGWLTSKVMSNYLKIMAQDMTAAQMKQMGLTDAQIKQFQQQAKTARDAATMVRTATQLFGTVKESIGSIWSEAFEIILGDFNEATNLFTSINDKVGSAIGKMGDSLIGFLKEWDKAGGRTAAIQSMVNLMQFFGNILRPIGQALRDVFKPLEGSALANGTKSLRDFTASLVKVTEDGSGVRRTFQGIFAALHLVLTILGGLAKVAAAAFGFIFRGAFQALGSISQLTGSVGSFFANLENGITSGRYFTQVMEFLGPALATVGRWIGHVTDRLPTMSQAMTVLRGAAHEVMETWRAWASYLPTTAQVMSALRAAADTLRAAFSYLKTEADGVIQTVRALTDQFGGYLVDRFEAAKTAIMGVADYLSSMGGKGSGQGLTTISHAADVAKSKFESLTESIKKLGGTGSLVSKLQYALNKIKPSGLAGIRKELVSLGGADALFDGIQRGLEFMGRQLAKLPGAFGKVASVAKEVFGIVKAEVQNIFKDFTAQDYEGVLNLASLTVAYAAYRRFTDMLTDLGDVLAGMGKGVTKVLDSTAGSLDAFSTKVKSEALINLGLALLVFAAGLLVLSLIKPENMGRALQAMSVLMAEMAAMFVVITKFTASLGLVSGAKMIALGAAMVVMAVGLSILAAAVLKMASVDIKSLATGLGAMAILMAEMGLFLFAMDKLDAKGSLVSALSILVLALALKSIVKTMADIAAMPMDAIVKGMGTLAVALGVLALAMHAMPPDTALLGLSLGVALMAIAGAVTILGALPYENLLKGVTTLAAVFAILAVGLTLMSGSLLGAAAVMVIALALAQLVPVIALLGTLSWEMIGKGLVALAGALLLLGLTAAGLSLIAPQIAALGLALIPLGAGLFLAGAATQMFAQGLVILVGLLAASGGVLLGFIGALTAMLPMIATAFATAFSNVVNIILAAAPGWIAALAIVIGALIQALINLAPRFQLLGSTYLMALANALGTAAPTLVARASQIIMLLVTAIAVLVPRIAALGIRMVVGLANAISAGLPQVANAGVRLVVSGLNAMANAIRGQQGAIRAAAMNLARALISALTGGLNFRSAISKALSGAKQIIQSVASGLNPGPALSKALAVGRAIGEGLVRGISAMAGAVMGAARALASRAADAIKSALKVNSPSKVIIPYGHAMGEGLVVGMQRSTGIVVGAGEDLGTTAAGALQGALQTASLAFEEMGDFEPTLTPVIDLSEVEKGAKRIDTLMSNSLASGVQATLGATSKSEVQAPTQVAQTSEKTPVQFIQNNYSPKELSPLDVYRNTKHQLIMAGGLV